MRRRVFLGACLATTGAAVAEAHHRLWHKGGPKPPPPEPIPPGPGVTVRYADGLSTPSANGTDLAAKIAASVNGDIVTVRPGGIYQGNFTLSNPGAGTTAVTIGPGDGTGLFALPLHRFTAADVPLCARIETNTQAAVFNVTNTAHHWTLRGLNITTTSAPFLAGSECPNLVGDAGSVSFTSHCHDITIDRCLIHPLEEDPMLHRGASHGLCINGADITYIRCSSYNFTGWVPPTTTGNTVTAGTNASLVQITLASDSTGLPSFSNWPVGVGAKRLVTFGGGANLTGSGGGDWRGINGTFLALRLTDTTFTLQSYDAATMTVLTNVNSSGWGTFAGQTVNLMTQSSSSNMAVQLIAGPGPYTIEDCFLEAVYTPVFSGGGGSLIDPLNDVTVTSTGNPLGTVTLSGKGVGGSDPLLVNDLIAFKTAVPQTISAATSASPCVITVPPHAYPVGGIIGIEEGGVAISGATAPWVLLNARTDLGNNTNDPDNIANVGNGRNRSGAYYGKVVNATTIELWKNRAFTIPLDTTGISAFTQGSGTVKWVPRSPGPVAVDKQWQVGKVTSISGSTGAWVVTYAHHGHTENPLGGNGAGVPIAQNSQVLFNGLVPHHITIRHSTIALRKSWIMAMKHACGTQENATDQGAKAIWESKMANDVLIEGNIVECIGGLTNVGAEQFAGPVGFGINQTSQSGDTPWCECSRWTIRSNWFKNITMTKLSLQEEYFSGGTSVDFVFANNLMTPSNVAFFALEGTDDVLIEHNTVRNLGGGDIGLNSFVDVQAHLNTNCIFRNNIGNWVSYGYNVPGGTFPAATWPGVVRERNFIIDNLNAGFGGANIGATDVRVVSDAPTGTLAMGFVNAADADAGGDRHGYQLRTDSMGYHQATDGKDVGVDFALLDAALAGEAGPASGSLNQLLGVLTGIITGVVTGGTPVAPIAVTKRGATSLVLSD
jgi:hypothetical protein